MAKIQLNGKKITLENKTSVLNLLVKYKIDYLKVAIELNGKILPKMKFKKRLLKNKDKLEVVQFIGGGQMKKDFFKVANIKINSRLIVGTGKYKNLRETAEAIKASGADMVTVAVRRVNIQDKKKPLLMDFVSPKKYKYLPNTAGCYNSNEALRTLRLAREIGGWKLVKLEVLGDRKTLYPNMIETIKSTKILVREGFKVMVYCTDDPIQAKILEDNGASAIMPLASPIGSGLGIQNKLNISMIIKNTKLPVIVDAGIGTASDATIAMEMGCDGVLINSAIAQSKKPILMAESFKNAVISGRQSFLAVRMKKSIIGNPSSSFKNLI